MNSTAVVLMIITVLTYGIVCIGKRMELMDAVTVSFAVLLAGFGMSGGILALFGGFSLNKTLAVLWLLSVVAAVICRIAGGKPNVCLKQTESIVRPFLRTLILLCLAGLVYVVTTHFQPEDDVMINAGKGFAQYLWLVSGIVLVLVCVADILIHCQPVFHKKFRIIFNGLVINFPVLVERSKGSIDQSFNFIHICVIFMSFNL